MSSVIEQDNFFPTRFLGVKGSKKAVRIEGGKDFHTRNLSENYRFPVGP